jgi:hypothetical protein
MEGERESEIERGCLRERLPRRKRERMEGET